LFFVFLFGVQSCGFQLNRNKIQLPNQARTISISKIDNRSFVARLDFKLKGLLVEKFNANSISVKSANQADLDLSFRINSFSMKRAEYALDETGQTYEFQFVVSGNLTIIDNRSNTVYLSDFALGSSHSVITKDLDLTTIEAEDGKEQVLNNLSQLIASKLTDNF
jgi:outer membrane lipopolysaccharide assembly protein LptE/RlpB